MSQILHSRPVGIFWLVSVARCIWCAQLRSDWCRINPLSRTSEAPPRPLPVLIAPSCRCDAPSCPYVRNSSSDVVITGSNDCPARVPANGQCAANTTHESGTGSAGRHRPVRSYTVPFRRARNIRQRTCDSTTWRRVWWSRPRAGCRPLQLVVRPAKQRILQVCVLSGSSRCTGAPGRKLLRVPTQQSCMRGPRSGTPIVLTGISE